MILVREKRMSKRIGILATEQTKGYYIDENINKNNNVIVMSLEIEITLKK